MSRGEVTSPLLNGHTLVLAEELGDAGKTLASSEIGEFLEGLPDEAKMKIGLALLKSAGVDFDDLGDSFSYSGVSRTELEESFSDHILDIMSRR